MKLDLTDMAIPNEPIEDLRFMVHVYEHRVQAYEAMLSKARELLLEAKTKLAVAEELRQANACKEEPK